MKILAIETSHVVGSIAAADGPDLLAEESFTEGMVHGRELVPRMKGLVDRMGWSPAGIDLLAVSIGPGSYTGLRVGIAAVKTIAYAMGTEVVAVPSLDVLAQNAPEGAKTVCPVVDAKRKQVYACVFDETRKPTEEYRVVNPDKLADALPANTLVLGDGLEYYADVFDRDGLIVGDKSLWQPRASIVAQVGAELYTGGQRDDFMSLTPLYFRRPEAEDRWRANEKQKQERGEK